MINTDLTRCITCPRVPSFLGAFKLGLLASTPMWIITGARAIEDDDRTVKIEEIVVTATKRAESTQDIPVAVQALGSAVLEQTDIDVFTDYLLRLPSVSAGGSGPGQGTIYIRGLASTTPNLTTAGVAGLAPNVALYLGRAAGDTGWDVTLMCM